MMGALQLTLLRAATYTYISSPITAADIAAILFAVSVLVVGT